MKQKPKNTSRHGQISLSVVAFFICSLRVFAGEADVSRLPPDASTQIDFARDIKPILENNCLRCHGPEKTRSRFRLDSREGALKGGEKGVDILPGKSARSPLIHYVAHLVEDMEMPPIGKGQQLTAAQVSLMRAWIDQGVVWDKAGVTNKTDFSFSPFLGGTAVSGDAQKFREQSWQKEGLNGPVENFEFFQQTGPDSKLHITGHALADDYKINLAEDRNNLGFIHSGWEQYRKYFDDTGVYDPLLIPAAPRLGEDLHLDIGKAWVDFGLTLPDLPRMVLGYEFDYKQGNEATLESGAVGGSSGTARNIAPASEHLNEAVHIIKFDLDHEINGVSIEERFRGEFYKLNTGQTNSVFNQGLQSTAQGTTYFQGANTIRLEKKFSDWFFGSAGYLYSKMNADSSFSLDAPALLQQASVPEISLEKESNVGNLNGLVTPFAGLTISMGAQAEFTRQNGFGAGNLAQDNPPLGTTNYLFILASDYNKTSLRENLSLRYSKIPFSAVYAEARLGQDNIGQDDQFAASRDILEKAVFLQHTDFSSRSSDLRFGFDTSPWRWASLSGSYRRYEDDSQYDSDPLVEPIVTGYPTFLLSRKIITDEVETKLVLHLSSRFKTTLSYQRNVDNYFVTTRPYVSFGNVISPGGQLNSAEDHSDTFSINSTFTPVPRLFLSATFSYQRSALVTAADDSTTVVPDRGDVYTALANGTFVLSQTTDLFAGFSFSDANYSQNNFAAGLPLGIQYQQRGVQVGISRKFGKNISAKLQYRFNYYDEPSSGGADNYRAQSVFGVMTFRFW